MQTEKLSSIGKLVAGIAHELNNPIATILLLAQQSLQEEDIQETTSNLTKIVLESKRTANIVGNLLLFARQQVQEHELENINEILTNVLDNLAPAIEMNNIEISFELYKDLPSILVDSDQIQQVIINIVNNACQSMGTDPKNYTLKIITEVGPSIYLSRSKMVQVVRIKFQDSGSGIHPDVLPRIFDPFFTTKKLEQGTGLGLSICHGIISEHGGHIWAESEYGQGATFFVELPIKTINSPLPAIEDKQVKNPMIGSGYKILIIDDEPNLLEIINRVLKRRGYQVNAVSNGEDGLTLALEINPDLILCDLLMPEVSGKDVYNQLKERAPELLNKIIFITGDSVSKESSQFLMETEIPYLNKPFELDFLIEFVEKAVLGEH